MLNQHKILRVHQLISLLQKELEPNKKTYILACSINNPQPITRFILGLSDEVDILGSKEFLNYFSKTSLD